MSQLIELASGKINTDTLTIELIEPAHGGLAKAVIHWPEHPTVCSSAALGAVIAATRTLSNAVLELARIEAGNNR